MLFHKRLMSKRVGGFLLAMVLAVWALGSCAAEAQAPFAAWLRVDELAPGEGGLYFARATVENLCDGGNEWPLYDVTLEIGLTDAADSSAPGVRLMLTEVAVADTNAAAVTVQTLDAQGAPNDVQKTIAEVGRVLALPQGTCGLLLRYFSSESDFRLMPVGFQAGRVLLGLSYQADGEQPSGSVAVLRMSGSLELRDPSAAKAVEIPTQEAPVAFPAPVNDAPVDDVPTNDASANDAPANDAPVNNAPTNNAPTNDAPTDNAPTNDAPVNNAPEGDAPANDTPTDNAPTDNAQNNGAAKDSIAGEQAEQEAIQPEGEEAPKENDSLIGQPSALTAVEGCAYADQNQSLTRDEGEPLMSGVQVSLQKKTETGWADVAATVTDAYGQYAFEQKEIGEFRVCAYTDAVDYYVAAVGDQERFAENSPAMCSDTIRLEDGDRSVGQADISLQTPASLQVTAFADGDGNGSRGKYERGAQGVRVEVIRDDIVIASGVTDSNGVATINGVRPGRHPLRFVLPYELGFTAKGENPADGDSCVGADENGGGTAVSDAFLFTAGQTVRAGVGVMAMGSFSGKVFEDLNNDGVMDEGDPGVAGVTLRLEGKRSGSVYTLVTDDTGLYRFSRLPNELYVFSATLPEGMLYARYSKTGGDLRSVFSGSVLTREFPVSNAANVTDKNVGVVQKGVLSGTVFLDLNYNGYYDEGEPGFGGVVLEAIKLSNNESLGKTASGLDGSFRLEGLRGGEYRLRAVVPDDGTVFTRVPSAGGENANLFEQRSGRRENSIQPITIRSGGEATALVGVAVGATVRGVVFQDADYNGIWSDAEKRLSGVEVRLTDAVGAVVARAVTNGEGKYALHGVMPGTYTLQVKRMTGSGFTRLRPSENGGSHVVELIGDYGVTAPMEIAMGQTIDNVNAGMLPASTITGKLFNDLNDDGLQGEGEEGLTEATVRLMSQDGEIDLTRSVAGDGTYFFDGVMPGEYTLTFQLPEHAEIARVAAGGNTQENKGRETVTGVFTVAMGTAYEYPLVGAVVLGSFEGYVFKDANANGVQDEGEAVLPGAEITLTPDRASAEEQSVKAGKDGAFALDMLRPAEYRLTIALPDGYIFSHNLDADGLTLDRVATQTLACPWRVLTNRTPKNVGAVKPASVAGVIWLDENKDGNRGRAETLMSGVPVELLDENTQAVAARTASTDGGFLFENVRPGTYTVRFAMPNQSEPAGDSRSTFALSGSYMRQTGVTVYEGQKLEGLTTGLVSRTSIGGKMLLEENGTAPVAGATVTLYASGGSDPVQTAQTGEDGSYRFDGLWPGEYTLEASLPEGMIFVRPNDPGFDPGASVISVVGENAGKSEPFELKMAQHRLEENVLLIRPGKVGDQVWLDENRNGLMDGGECMIPGVKIALMQEETVMYETVSDAYGYYLFDAVYPGVYTLRAQAYPELEIATGVEALRVISSCLVSGDGAEARSDSFTVQSGGTDMDCNLGYTLREGQAAPEWAAEPAGRNWSLSNQKYTAMQE